MKIEELVKKGERKNIEFKEYLCRKAHLIKDRKLSLASQMKYRVLSGEGKAVYVIGVTDSGEIKGLNKEKLEESFNVLQEIAKEAGLSIARKKIIEKNGNFVGIAFIERALQKEHLLIGTAGHVDHGKSTLVGCLVSGELDNGDGKTRIFLDTQKHEIERGLSADLSYAVYGFKNGKAIRLKNPLSKSERASVVEKADKIVTFVDTVGHEPWLRTTIRGIVGQKLDYGILTIAGDEGITHITKEHLGLLLAMELPVIIVITKCDRADEEKLARLEGEIKKLLSLVGKVPTFVRSKRDIEHLPAFWETKIIVPVIRTSSVSGEGLELLDELFKFLPKRIERVERSKDFLMYIDKIYTVKGVGIVVSGSVKEGVLRKGQEIFIGPTSEGEFKKVKAPSLEVHHFSVDTAEVGEIVGIALRGLDFEVRRGMIVSTRKDLKSTWEFEAEVVILNHPTKIAKGYEPVIHLETISETIIIEPLDTEFLAAGDKGRVKIRFKYHPYYIREGQKFIFREGRSKGIGVVMKVLE